jgi:phosphoribosylglycinamide formyltransferase-1
MNKEEQKERNKNFSLSIIKQSEIHNPKSEIGNVAEQFVSESITPVKGMAALARTTGGPALPRQFVWKERVLEIQEVIACWRETGPCRHGSGEVYVRKHWYEVRTTSGAVAKLYFERQFRSTSQKTRRWWLFSIKDATESMACP